ncbi:D-3-phosphoglycerate dehydrogenase [Striga asiatica]|uniref:D-3-phosphoglycerate dehydrogenase n=1 Tax=Striga asiatica TaxID=4170 RepID=A0A5A7Q569_STRAF|nr:D-3-phosphoglycerate dehydrogenase [Striga asiatica]
MLGANLFVLALVSFTKCSHKNGWNTNQNKNPKSQTLRASKFSHSLGPLRNSVLRKLTWQHQPHRRLDLPRSDGRLLVVPRELRRLLGELLENVVDEAVHDSHGLARDPDVGMDLLQDLEDVDFVGLHTPLRPLLLLLTGGGTAVLRELLPGLGLLLRWGLLSNRRLLLLCWLLFGGLLFCLWCHCRDG